MPARGSRTTVTGTVTAVLPRMTLIFYMSAILPFYAMAIAWWLARLPARVVAGASIALVIGGALWALYTRPLTIGTPLDATERAKYFEGPFAPIFLHARIPMKDALDDARKNEKVLTGQ